MQILLLFITSNFVFLNVKFVESVSQKDITDECHFNWRLIKTLMFFKLLSVIIIYDH